MVCILIVIDVFSGVVLHWQAKLSIKQKQVRQAWK